MASTILYKFRSGTTFEALPLPGSAARLFDVKKAIVKAKKLDSGSMEFDLGVRNADTNEEYSNEAMLLPRGTRLIVQRLPAQRGHGFLARMARNEQAGTGMGTQGSSNSNSFYTIENREGDLDEFVSNEESEIAALQAATNLQSSGPAMTGGGYAASGRGNFPSGGGGGAPKRTFAPRPNADPELRLQEQKNQPKKARTTGIPRTFQSLAAPEVAEGEETAVPVLQPNTQGFKDLVSRGGGQSEKVSGTRHDLDYALKLTASTVPDYLLCPICNKALKNATLLPWDPEGRSTCESCIRDALTQSGFRCPLTGMEGVSPDDLLPNIGLRKAVDMFIKGVMDKVDEVEQMRVEEDENVGADTTAGSGLTGDILEGDGTEKGVIVSRKSSLVRKKFEEDDPFADDDDFGGDVFAVEVEKKSEEEIEEKKEEMKEKSDAVPATKAEDKTANESKEADSNRVDKVETNPNSSDPSTSGNAQDSTTSAAAEKVGEGESEKQEDSSPPPPKRRRRGPPAGYTMGPAGYNRNNKDSGDRRGGGRGGGYRGRGGGNRGGRDNDYSNRGSGGGRYDSRDGGNDHGQDDDRSHSSKRSRNDDHSEGGGHRDKHARHDRYDDRDNRYEPDDRNRRGGDGGGRGFHRGGFRGGGGRGGRSWGGGGRGSGGGGGGGYRGGHGRRY